MVEYHPISPRDQAKIHQFGKKVLPEIFLEYELITEGIWTGRFRKVGCIKYLLRIHAKEILIRQDDEYIFPVEDATAKLSGRDYEFRAKISEHWMMNQPTKTTVHAEVRADFWSIQGDFICRRLSDSWKGFTKFTSLKEEPPKGWLWSRVRLTKIQTTTDQIMCGLKYGAKFGNPLEIEKKEWQEGSTILIQMTKNTRNPPQCEAETGKAYGITHYILVHQYMPMPQGMKIPVAKAAVDKECEKLEKILAWNLTKVKSKKEVILEAQRDKKKSTLPHWRTCVTSKMRSWNENYRNTTAASCSSKTL